jgi:hypothetical protein
MKTVDEVRERMEGVEGPKSWDWGETKLLEVKAVLSKTLFPKNKNLAPLFEGLSLVYRLKGDFELALKYAESALDVLLSHCTPGTVSHMNGLIAVIDRQSEYIRFLSDKDQSPTQRTLIGELMAKNVEEVLSLLGRNARHSVGYYKNRFNSLMKHLE